MRYKFHPPIVVQKLFSNFIWKSSNNKIHLTFDDGPTVSSTEKILNVLKKNNLKAIFFCVGNNIIKYSALTEKILVDGHAVANHTMSHKLLTSMNMEETISELSTFNEMMKEKFNYQVKYFRPPHGRFNLKTNSLLNKLNMKCVMWNLITYDYENKIDKVKYAIDNYLNENSIIVMHDNLKSSNIIEEALNYTIEQADKKGFSFGEPEDCLK